MFKKIVSAFLVTFFVATVAFGVTNQTACSPKTDLTIIHNAEEAAKNALAFCVLANPYLSWNELHVACGVTVALEPYLLALLEDIDRWLSDAGPETAGLWYRDLDASALVEARRRRAARDGG